MPVMARQISSGHRILHRHALSVYNWMSVSPRGANRRA
ncbi:hypothetical protein BDFB_006064 [Asbolus verrucosus]|uniref:Uncharacterized protein n=1 Tax=Asbolus verrucosus TaxID=1661398 RepID=A0A482VHF4_ASBVE|nr:hypothetical protein BDFB_006064 [Asbolus verrucosus]